MRPRHCRHVNGFTVFIVALLAIPLVVSKAIFDSDNDPAGDFVKRLRDWLQSGNCAALRFLTYHKLVKTTPNPKATKNSNGELVGPPPPPPPPLLLPPLLDVVAGGTPIVSVDEGSATNEVMVADTALITSPKVRMVHCHDLAHHPT